MSRRPSYTGPPNGKSRYDGLWFNSFYDYREWVNMWMPLTRPLNMIRQPDPPQPWSSASRLKSSWLHHIHQAMMKFEIGDYLRMQPILLSWFLSPSSYTWRRTSELCKFLIYGCIIKPKEEENYQSNWAIDSTLFHLVWQLCGKIRVVWLASIMSKITGVWCQCQFGIFSRLWCQSYEN